MRFKSNINVPIQLKFINFPFKIYHIIVFEQNMCEKCIFIVQKRVNISQTISRCIQISECSRKKMWAANTHPCRIFCMAVFIVRPIIWKIVPYERRPGPTVSIAASKWFMIIEKIQTEIVCIIYMYWMFSHGFTHTYMYIRISCMYCIWQYYIKWNYTLYKQIMYIGYPAAVVIIIIVNRYQLTHNTAKDVIPMVYVCIYNSYIYNLYLHVLPY